MRAFALAFVFGSVLALTVSSHAGVIKNSQTLLSGTLTRAGNSNRAELNDGQLSALCEQGYTRAYFLYKGANARSITCSQGTINYRSQSINEMTPMLEEIYRGIKSGSKVFVHCNNGAHASGLVGAMALRQFCGYSAEAAFKYWNSHLAGYALQPENVAGIKRRISKFVPSANLKLTPAEQAQVCK
jgi:hypothetical protein